MEARLKNTSLNLLIHPGEHIADLLEDRGWTTEQLATMAGLSSKTLDGIVAQKKGITPEVAAGLANAIGTSQGFWLNLQSNYDERLRESESKSTQILQMPFPRTTQPDTMTMRA